MEKLLRAGRLKIGRIWTWRDGNWERYSGQGKSKEQILGDWMGKTDVVWFGGRELGMVGNEPGTLS